MTPRLETLRELLGDAIGQSVVVADEPTPANTAQLAKLCTRAAAKAQAIHNQARQVPEPREGE